MRNTTRHTGTDTHRPGLPDIWRHRRRRLATAAVAAIALVAPATAFANGGFTDVAPSNVFAEDIEWLADAGVTKGCNPPANDQFCPKGTVTRATMAAFMHRLATGRVVDARTATSAQTAGTAEEASLLDGRSADALERPLWMVAGDGDYNGLASFSGAVRTVDWRSRNVGGVLLVRHTGSWTAAGDDYLVRVWAEIAAAGNCDNPLDDDAIIGTLSTFSTADADWGQTVGQGYVSVAPRSMGEAVLCMAASGPDAPTNMAYSFSVEFVPNATVPQA